LKVTSNQAQNVAVYHDPESRQTSTEQGSGATIGSNMLVHVPFIVDL